MSVCQRDRTHGVAFGDWGFFVFQVTFASLHSGHCMADGLANVKMRLFADFCCTRHNCCLFDRLLSALFLPCAFLSHFCSLQALRGWLWGVECYLSPPAQTIVPSTFQSYRVIFPLNALSFLLFSCIFLLLLVCQMAFQVVLPRGMECCYRDFAATWKSGFPSVQFPQPA